MCAGCWAQYGYPVLWDDDIAEAVRLIGELKTKDRCGAGGPLHIVTDDDNIGDEWVNRRPWNYNRKTWGGQGVGWIDTGEPDWPPDVIEICDKILELLGDMSVAERACVLAYHWGYAQEYIAALWAQKPWEQENRSK